MIHLNRSHFKIPNLARLNRHASAFHFNNKNNIAVDRQIIMRFEVSLSHNNHSSVK